MRRSPLFVVPFLILVAPALGAGKDDPKPTISAADLDFFESKVRPILVANCASCHSATKTKGGLRLDTRELAVKGGDNGPAIVPGHPEMSKLIEAVLYEGDLQMPPKGKLKKAEVAALTDWVKRGAPWPAANAAAKVENPADGIAERMKKAKEFWSLRPVTDPPPPKVKDVAWPRTTIDRFILAKLEEKGLHPSGEADRRTWIRRASFDVTGLPPTPEEVERFVNDPSPNAYEKVVERLLDSPAHGERWGRHWLDIARYGEDQAHSFQPRLYPQGFRYRDWVAAAFNRDLPYDRFLLEQIAGDLLPEPGLAERLPALGFFALGPVYYGDAKKHDQVDDRIDTLTRGVLGLTVACARCHDHKYDPVPTSDYYALAGIFHSTEYKEAPLAPKEIVEAYDKAQAAVDKLTTDIEAFLKKGAADAGKLRAEQAAKYVLAVWTLRNKRAEKAGMKAAEVAKSEKLDAALLDKWDKYLSDDAMMKQRPALAAWVEMTRKHKPEPKLADDPAAVAEARKAADAIQAALLDVAARKGKPFDPKGKAKPLSDVEKKFHDDFFADNTGLFSVPKNRMASVLSDDARKKHEAMKSDLEKLKKAVPPKYPIAHSLTEGTPRNSKILIRGNDATQGDESPRKFLTALGGTAPFKYGSGRLELARAVADRNNPLTARVFVNRVWRYYFGRGIVATSSNFGALGEKPTHPELLDHLATSFMNKGWSIKSLHRSILLSAAYRQSSDEDSRAMEVDPLNTLVWRMSRKRLEIEAWRDAMLAVSGRLDRTIGGPSIGLDSADNNRRTFYAKISRHDLSPLLRLFDFPDPNITSAERTRTTVALQQLIVLNDEFLIRNARELAKSLEKTGDDEARIKRAYSLLFSRSPSPREIEIGKRYLKAADSVDPKAPNDLSRWDRYAQALLASNEFLYID